MQLELECHHPPPVNKSVEQKGVNWQGLLSPLQTTSSDHLTAEQKAPQVKQRLLRLNNEQSILYNGGVEGVFFWIENKSLTLPFSIYSLILILEDTPLYPTSKLEEEPNICWSQI